MMTPEQRAARTFGQVVAICPGGLEAITAALREAIAEADELGADVAADLVAQEREAIAIITDHWGRVYGDVCGEMFHRLAEVIRARANPPGPTTPPPAEAESPPPAGSPLRP